MPYLVLVVVVEKIINILRGVKWPMLAAKC
jgi:hypothetical protein